MGLEKGGLYQQVVFISRFLLYMIRTICSEIDCLRIQLIFLDSCHIIHVSLYQYLLIVDPCHVIEFLRKYWLCEKCYFFQYHTPRRCADGCDYSPYSLSPVGSKSQKLLRSPRKAVRKISKIPFKVTFFLLPAHTFNLIHDILTLRWYTSDILVILGTIYAYGSVSKVAIFYTWKIQT